MYKGILSSGVEIAVLSTSIRSSQLWSSHAEREFKSKVLSSPSQYKVLDGPYLLLDRLAY